MDPLHDRGSRGFASDNYAGTHPEVIDAIASANGGHVSSYGEDPWTARLQQLFAGLLGDGVAVFPVFNGTGANVVGLQSMLTRWGAVIAPSLAHINTDEGGAPEKVGGMKIVPVPTPDAKLTPDLVSAVSGSRGVHQAVPQVVSITQSTELGTLYSVDEIAALADRARSLGLAVHMDGARIANAAAALGVPLRAFTRDVGVDVLSFGGTKNGAIGAEAVVVLNPDAVHGVDYLRKTAMQLASKMRFVSAQLVALLTDDLWLRSGARANAMAARLRAGVEAGLADGTIRGVAFTQPTQTNGVFATLSAGVADRLRERFRFYDWNEATGEVRWLTSFDTAEDDVDAFVAAIAAETGA
ncbi:threonine aldolase family protein [Microbacterium marinilacus]|uniref:Low specificity L-threonine aldolase n=1 Tax=Microbacterium marinilacus TaxID=415209 RepID=A0ABP7BD22_9MICO|nr:beta-eliminating lyase-related protein [Microbacterium marinilacus]MBY0690217.1 threonine aldolase [Microbacterium marinilacus]